MIDYGILYKEQLPLDTAWPGENRWDLFISAFNSSERVAYVFWKADATSKHWLIHPDYEYLKDEYPKGDCFFYPTRYEGEFIRQYMRDAGTNLRNKRVCIDITGFLKPYMMFLLAWFKNHGLNQFDVIYSEPGHYVRKEETQFSDEAVVEVRQVSMFEGLHVSDTSNDILIIGAGYDHELMAQAAESKDNAKKLKIFGLPSLRPDMYQENVLRASRAEEAANRVGEESYFAPANDPFVTANVLAKIVAKQQAIMKITNLYLCPVATKPQALGFAIYYLSECVGRPVSLIYPFCATHSRKTSTGISRIWKYRVELPA